MRPALVLIAIACTTSCTFRVPLGAFSDDAAPNSDVALADAHDTIVSALDADAANAPNRDAGPQDASPHDDASSDASCTVLRELPAAECSAPCSSADASAQCCSQWSLQWSGWSAFEPFNDPRIDARSSMIVYRRDNGLLHLDTFHDQGRGVMVHEESNWPINASVVVAGGTSGGAFVTLLNDTDRGASAVVATSPTYRLAQRTSEAVEPPFESATVVSSTSATYIVIARSFTAQLDVDRVTITDAGVRRERVLSLPISSVALSLATLSQRSNPRIAWLDRGQTLHFATLIEDACDAGPCPLRALQIEQTCEQRGPTETLARGEWDTSPTLAVYDPPTGRLRIERYSPSATTRLGVRTYTITANATTVRRYLGQSDERVIAYVRSPPLASTFVLR